MRFYDRSLIFVGLAVCVDDTFAFTGEISRIIITQIVEQDFYLALHVGLGFIHRNLVGNLIHRSVRRSHDAVFYIILFEHAEQNIQILLPEYFEADDFLSFGSDNFDRLDTTGEFVFGERDGEFSLRNATAIDGHGLVGSCAAFDFASGKRENESVGLLGAIVESFYLRS